MINKEGLVKISKLKINSKNLFKLTNSMMLIYTGVSRDSSEQIKRINNELDNENSTYIKYLHFQKKKCF